jgi:hypothetical protein
MLRSTTAANAAATTTPPRTVASRAPKSSSITKVTAAIGALKAAAIPAAAPTGTSRRWLLGDSANARPIPLATVEQICTVGPSRPSEEPVPMATLASTNFAAASRSRGAPSCRSAHRTP